MKEIRYKTFFLLIQKHVLGKVQSFSSIYSAKDNSMDVNLHRAVYGAFATNED